MRIVLALWSIYRGFHIFEDTQANSTKLVYWLYQTSQVDNYQSVDTPYPILDGGWLLDISLFLNYCELQFLESDFELMVLVLIKFNLWMWFFSHQTLLRFFAFLFFSTFGATRGWGSSQHFLRRRLKLQKSAGNGIRTRDAKLQKSCGDKIRTWTNSQYKVDDGE